MNTKMQIIVPAITPLTDEGNIDEQSVEKMFINFSKSECNPFILGTTGEAASIPLHLKKQYVKVAARLKKQIKTIYAGISSNCLKESIEFAKYCFENQVDVVAAHLPSYYLLSGSQVKSYFLQLADSIAGPLIIYNIPATTRMSIPLEILDELSYHPNIIGAKDSERNEERLQQSLSLWKDRKDFKHYLGWAAKSAEALLNGSNGLVPSTGNLNPNIYREMVSAVEDGNKDAAYSRQLVSDALGELYQKGKLLGESLWALKVLMKHDGLCQTYMMPPLQQMGRDEEKKLIAEYEKLKEKQFINF